MNTMPPTAEMQQAYRERDASYHGLFFLGVRTTGIFCRLTCPARKPIAKNVEYFPTARAALVAGYRPCKRCRPLESVISRNGRPSCVVSRVVAQPTRVTVTAPIASVLVVHAKMFVVNAHNPLVLWLAVLPSVLL